MEELLKQIAEKLGYATPLLYAGITYKLFAWLDKDVSPEAKAALSRTMRLGAISKLEALPNTQLADALVEVFDRIYTFPLKSGGAFLRSALFTILVTLLVVYELSGFLEATPHVIFSLIFATLFNIGTDYFSLFIIRAWLLRAGRRPVFALLGGTLIGVTFVLTASAIRIAITYVVELKYTFAQVEADAISSIMISIVYTFPGVVIFAWLPLFGLAMLLIRALNPLSRLVALAQWSLSDGKERPLKAAGLVAALLTLLLVGGWQAIFRSAVPDKGDMHQSSVRAKPHSRLGMYRNDPVGAAQAL